MITQKIISRTAAAIFWCPVIFFSWLLTHNAVLYFTHGGEYGILPEKLVARNDLMWNIAFYIHLPTGIICLLTPLFLFARQYFRLTIPLHAIVGRIYVWITLLLVCPTGMYIALYAKGGLITQVGFMLQGILLGWYTYKGNRAIMSGKRMEHIHYMMRSYAVATVVLTFRIFHILFFLWNVPYHDNYAISQWLGLSFNMLVAEALIAMMNFRTKNNRSLNLQLK